MSDTNTIRDLITAIEAFSAKPMSDTAGRWLALDLLCRTAVSAKPALEAPRAPGETT